MEDEADVEGLVDPGVAVAEYWRDAEHGIAALLEALRRYYPLTAADEARSLALTAEERYRRIALRSCDLVDLANLPESDRHLATRDLELRRLYVALRVRVELPRDATDGPRGGGRAADPLGGSGGDGADLAARLSVGERLGAARRLVVLGDPGAGKSTLLRWLATAYLLRLADDPDWSALPDVASLPDADWIPIMVRCRDLDPGQTGQSILDLLGQTLHQAELDDAECSAVVEALTRRLKDGTALLLIDGLDELTDPKARIRMCRSMERAVVAYPDAPVVVTSGIVGYREMGHRIGRRFEHLTVVDFTWEDKDDFAARWCAVTEPPQRRDAATRELIADIHSADRIERLTGNPMLLTTMALVKRKVGKLPSRRADLYWEAVQVLLNWRREIDEPLAQREALPQLEYLAYAMCDRGVQRLREDEILKLLEEFRTEYSQIHPAGDHSPEKFLRLLERRTGILVEAGRIRHNGRPAPSSSSATSPFKNTSPGAPWSRVTSRVATGRKASPTTPLRWLAGYLRTTLTKAQSRTLRSPRTGGRRSGCAWHPVTTTTWTRCFTQSSTRWKARTPSGWGGHGRSSRRCASPTSPTSVPTQPSSSSARLLNTSVF
jgi:hypothetical protein